MLINNVLNHGFENVKGKIAVISDNSNLPSALSIIKNIKDSEIDLYVDTQNNAILINDIKDNEDSISSCECPVFEYSVCDIFSPFEYNAVICVGESSKMATIVKKCKAYATPVIS